MAIVGLVIVLLELSFFYCDFNVICVCICFWLRCLVCDLCLITARVWVCVTYLICWFAA